MDFKHFGEQKVAPCEIIIHIRKKKQNSIWVGPIFLPWISSAPVKSRKKKYPLAPARYFTWKAPG